MDYDSAPAKIMKDLSSDLVSDLPTEITEKILTLLPIRDAIRTSILSTKWRYRWATLPSIVFDDSCLTGLNRDTIFSLINLVNQVLLLHVGPIQKFKLVIPFDPNCINLEQWLLILSRKDISELSLVFRVRNWCFIPIMPRIASCLFSFRSLTHLDLRHCELNPPPTFKGFPCLKSLILENVLAPRSGIEDIISLSPLLDIFIWSGKLDMTIHAPNLRFLALFGDLGEFCLDCSPLLSKVVIGLTDDVVDRSSAYKFAKLFRGLSKLVDLHGILHFIKIVSAGTGELNVSSLYPRLRFITLSNVGFKDTREISVVLHIMMCSPRLRELTIDVECTAKSTPDEGDAASSLDTMCKSGYTFKDLKVVKLTEFVGLPNQMKFVEFILGNSPALSTLSIKPCEHLKEGEGSMLKELVSYRRASPFAEVLLSQP